MFNQQDSVIDFGNKTNRILPRSEIVELENVVITNLLQNLTRNSPEESNNNSFS